MKNFVIVFFALSSVFLAGCYSSPQDNSYREFTIKKGFDAVWDVTLAALSETYTIEAQDRAKGVITTQTQVMNGWQISQIADLWWPAWMSFELRGRHSVTANITSISSIETKLRITPTMEWVSEKVYTLKPEQKFYDDLYLKITGTQNSELIRQIRELAAAVEH